MRDKPKNFDDNGADPQLAAQQAAFVRLALVGRNPEGIIKRTTIRIEGAEVDAGFEVAFLMIIDIYVVSPDGLAVELAIINVIPVFKLGTSLPQWWDLFEKALQKSHISVEQARIYLREQIQNAKLFDIIRVTIASIEDLKVIVEGEYVHETLSEKVLFAISEKNNHGKPDHKVAYAVKLLEYVDDAHLPSWYMRFKNQIEGIIFNTLEGARRYLSNTADIMNNEEP